MSESKKTPATDAPRVKNLHAEVPEDLHRRIKMLCVIKGTTLKEYVYRALQEKVARDDRSLAK